MTQKVRVGTFRVILTLSYLHAVQSFALPSLGALAAAAAVTLSPAHISCVPSPDDFDYSCQQSTQGAQQVIWRAGRPLVVNQAWGEGSTSTGASMWPSAVALSQYMDDQGAGWCVDLVLTFYQSMATWQLMRNKKCYNLRN